ncbi:hypothetical protein FRC11_000254, partial [Ceratobasidium sp. 423]
MDSRAPSPTGSVYDDLEPHELWGEHKRPYLFVLHYVELFDRHEGDWEPKSTEELDRCISMVRDNKAQVSVSELETMLQSARTWQLFEHFTCDSLDLIPHFMELLKSYCEENWIFERYYGFLCFQLLTNVMLAGIINKSKKREHAFDFIRNRSSGSIDIASSVAGYSAAMMEGIITSDPEYQEEMFSTLFVDTYQEGEYILLPGLGGFREKDALWLLDELWEYRGPFVCLTAGVCGMMPGWAVLFTAIWRHVKKAQGSTVLLKKLRNILLRYALTAIEPEFGLVCNIVSEIEEQVPSTVTENEDFPPVDKRDIEFMVLLFMKYLDSEKQGRPPSVMMCFPFAMVYHNALTTIPDQVPPLLAAVIECIWKTLGKTGSGLTLRERMVEAFGYAVNIIMSMCSVLIKGEHLEESNRVAVIVWTKLLRDVNMLELVGRLCSIAVIVLTCVTASAHEQFEDLAQSTRHFMDSLKGITRINELGNLDDLHHTWDKVLRYIDLQLSVYPPGGLVQHRIRVCRSIWFNVGAVFKFKQTALQQNRCMNPRCPDPFPAGGAQC